ncbi:DUF4062 domain-containing protein [Undibacterium crateris]|uniref:DUF4062 domain-containing protein n=1 Tax=Undibacterium crateris TaxID=2528175 RepID=UPI00138A45DE|nr:DUF4062 domain-containing protein [Undibacterium crateris]NDI85547.1 DUF4062 domain-containing protein [Undibacterium crateris]
MTTVFVSSTPFDLAVHRKRLSEEFAREAADYFGATLTSALPETPIEDRLRLVRSAKAYIGVFGMVFGDVDASTGKSLIQLEYLEAQLYCVPTLIYLIDEDEHPILPKNVDTGIAAQWLADFKAQLSQSHDVRFFDSPDDLVAKIHNDLHRVLSPAQKTAAAAAPALAPVPVPVAVAPVTVAAVVTPQAQPAALSAAAPETVETAAVPAVKKNSQRYLLTEPRFAFFKSKVLPVLPPDFDDVPLKDALELLLASNTLSAASSLARGAAMPLEDAVEVIRKMELIIIDTIYKQKNGG